MEEEEREKLLVLELPPTKCESDMDGRMFRKSILFRKSVENKLSFKMFTDSKMKENQIDDI